MNTEPSIKDLQNETQNNLQDVEKYLELYPFLSQTGEMSQQQTEQECIRIIDLITDSFYKTYPERKHKEMSQQEKIQGMKIVDLIKKGYLVIQQHKQNFQEMI